MGCCQSHTDSSSIPVNTVVLNMIDNIKQNSQSNQNNSSGQSSNKLHSQPINKEFTEYEYSLHKIQSDNKQCQNSVSIMMENSQSISNNKPKFYAQIHPQDNTHNTQNSHNTHNRHLNNNQSLSKSNLTLSSIFLKQSLPISKIQLLQQLNIFQIQFSNLGSDSSQFDKQPQQIDNKKQIQLQLLKQAFNSFSDRQLIELHDQLASMIVKCNQTSSANKKSVIEEIIQKNNPTDKQQEEQLEKIWSKDLEQPEFKQSKLKNQFIISNKHTNISEGSNKLCQQNKKKCQKPPNSNHPNSQKKQQHNPNFNLKQKNRPSITKPLNYICKDGKRSTKLEQKSLNLIKAISKKLGTQATIIIKDQIQIQIKIKIRQYIFKISQIIQMNLQ